METPERSSNNAVIALAIIAAVVIVVILILALNQPSGTTTVVPDGDGDIVPTVIVTIEGEDEVEPPPVEETPSD